MEIGSDLSTYKENNDNINAKIIERVKKSSEDEIPNAGLNSGIIKDNQQQKAQSQNIQQNIQQQEVQQNAQRRKKAVYMQRSRILSELELEENKKAFGDSTLMKNIKMSAKKIEKLTDLSVPLSEANFKNSIGLMNQHYDILLSYCREYIHINGHKRTGLAGKRVGYIRRLLAVSECERKNLEGAAALVKENHRGEKELLNWREVLRRARMEETAPDNNKYNTVAITRENKHSFDNAVGISRVAEYLGAADIFLKRDYVLENGQPKLRGELSNKEGYITLDDYKNSPEAGRIRMSPEVFRKMQTIRAIEDLLGISINAKEIYIKCQNVTERHGEEAIKKSNITDVYVNLGGHRHMVKRMEDEKKNAGIFVERKIANSILAMDVDVMSRLFADLLTAEDNEIFKKNITKMQKRFKKNNTRVLGENDFIINGNQMLKAAKKDVEKSVSKRGNQNRTNQNRTVLPTEYFLGKAEAEVLIDSENIEKIDVESEANAANGIRVRREDNAAIMAWYTNRQAEKNRQEQIRLQGMTPKQLKKHRDAEKKIKNICKEDDATILAMAKAAYRYDASKKGRNVQEWELYLTNKNNPPVFDHVPTPEDIKQGMVGDCYLLSSLSALVKNNPRLIMNMIEDMGDYVLVKFPKKTVPVSKKVVMIRKAEPNAEGNDYYARGTLWVQLIEKAYGRLCTGNLDDEKKHIFSEYLRAERNIHMSPNEIASVADIFTHSVECISGGSEETALEDLTGQKFISKRLDIITVGAMDRPYKKMWDRANKGDVRTGAQPFSGEEKYLQEKLQDSLKAEIERRYRIKYTSENGEITTSSYRSVTIEGIKEILLDIKNWTFEKDGMDYSDLYNEVRKRYHITDATFDEKAFTNILINMAGKLEAACDRANNSFEHESYKGNVHKYSKRARRIAAYLKEALKYGVITAGSNRFIKSNGEGLNSEQMSAGIVEGHAYTITEYHEKQNTGQITLTLRNPWGTGSVEYIKIKDPKTGQISTSRRRKKADDDGNFEIDLNDFMQTFSIVSAAEDVMAKREVKEAYKAI